MHIRFIRLILLFVLFVGVGVFHHAAEARTFTTSAEAKEWCKKTWGDTFYVNHYSEGVGNGKFYCDDVKGFVVSSGTSSNPVTPGTLRPGMKGDSVLALQKKLSELGLYTKALDGSYGPGTMAAVRAYQISQGLTADGIAGAKTFLKIGVVSSTDSGSGSTGGNPGNSNALIYNGTHTEMVEKCKNIWGSAWVDHVWEGPSGTSDDYHCEDRVQLQITDTLRPGATGLQVRNLQDFLLQKGYSLTTTGVYDQKTIDAVSKFQASTGLSSDGVLGPKTLRALMSAGIVASPATPVNSSPASMSPLIR